ncbi:MAG: acyloxyacyl hydrolase [Stellaceae bacterium]
MLQQPGGNEVSFYRLRMLTGAVGFVLVLATAQGARAQSAPFFLGPFLLAGDRGSYLDLGAGAFNLSAYGPSGALGAARLEYRYGRKLFHLGPALGLLVNAKGGVLGYAGAYADLQYEQFNLTPLLAVAGYARGHGEDLGGAFQFRASLELSYTILPQFTRIGIDVAHVGNAGIERRNPGGNEILLSYAVPLPRPF